MESQETTALRESLSDFGSVRADPPDQDDAVRDHVITNSTEFDVRISHVSQQRQRDVARRRNRVDPIVGFHDKSTIRKTSLVARGQYTYFSKHWHCIWPP